MRGATAVSRAILAAALVLAAALSGTASAAEAVTIDAARIEGTFSGADDDLRFTSPRGPLDLSAVARIRWPRPRLAIPLVAGLRTTDGTLVRGAVTVGEGGDIGVASARLGKVTFPAESVFEVYFDAAGPLPANGAPGALLANGDFLSADSLVLSANGVSGRSAIGPFELPLERIAAIRLPDRDTSPPLSLVVLENGDLLAGPLKSADAEALVAETAAGALTVPVEFVCELRYTRRIAYIRDLETTVSTRAFAPEGPRYFAKGEPVPSREGDKSVPLDGFLTRAGAVVAVKLPPGARALSFVPEIAPGSNPPGGVFAVRLGQKDVWTKKLEAGAPGEPVTLRLSGATGAAFAYDSAPDGLLGSLGLWRDAFVTIGP